MTDDPHPAAPEPIVVTVARSGGIAGLTRRWGVQAPPSDPEHWHTLVDACPWNHGVDESEGMDAERATGADRFAWTVEVSCAGSHHRAALSETQATGPWRALIDAVRAASAGPG